MQKLIDHIEKYGFTCEAGPLENCIGWIKLKKLVNANNDLLEKISWYFETTEAMSTVHSLLCSQQRGCLLSAKQAKRWGAYRRLAIMAGETESDLRELV